MVIAFVVFAVIGIFVGALLFFYGLALFNSYILSAKTLSVNNISKDSENKDGVESVSEEVNVSERSNKEEKSETANLQNIESEYNADDPEIIEKRKKLFTPLPYLLLVQGVILFVFNAVMIVLKFRFPKIMEFYILLAINIGFLLLSLFVNACVMARKSDDDETKVDNSIDKTE